MNGLVWLGVALLIMWLLLWLVFHIVAGAIHLIVLVAIALIVWGLVKKGARAVDRNL